MSSAGQPSIYVRLMPLMHALIGASVALFLNTLFCGRPLVKKCKPCVERTSSRAPTPAADLSLRDARLEPKAAPPAVDAGSAGPADLAAGPAPDAVAAAAPDRVGAVPAADDALPVDAVDRRLLAAIDPCVNPRASSFRLGLRLRPGGRVRRAFVPRDPGVSAAMATCIQRTLGGFALPEATYGGEYVEWRVRRADGQLSLTLVRPPR